MCFSLYKSISMCTCTLYLTQCNIKISLAPEGAKQGNFVLCYHLSTSGEIWQNRPFMVCFSSQHHVSGGKHNVLKSLDDGRFGLRVILLAFGSAFHRSEE